MQIWNDSHAKLGIEIIRYGLILHLSKQTQPRARPMTIETVTVYNKDKTKTFQATVLGYVDGKTFVEHPTLGDEAPILVRNMDGTCKRTHAWDMDSVRAGNY